MKTNELSYTSVSQPRTEHRSPAHVEEVPHGALLRVVGLRRVPGCGTDALVFELEQVLPFHLRHADKKKKKKRPIIKRTKHNDMSSVLGFDRTPNKCLLYLSDFRGSVESFRARWSMAAPFQVLETAAVPNRTLGTLRTHFKLGTHSKPFTTLNTLHT